MNNENNDMEEYMKTLREQLYAAIRRNNWTMTIAADRCGIHRNELSNILSGRSKDIRLSTLVRISEALEQPIINLICSEKTQSENGVEFIRKLYADMIAYMQKGGAII